MWWMALIDAAQKNQEAKGGGQQNAGAAMPPLLQELQGVLNLGGQKSQPAPLDVYNSMQPQQTAQMTPQQSNFTQSFPQGFGFGNQTAGSNQSQVNQILASQKNQPWYVTKM